MVVSLWESQLGLRLHDAASKEGLPKKGIGRSGVLPDLKAGRHPILS